VVPNQVRAAEGGEVWVTPPGKRFAAGTWKFELSDASAGATLETRERARSICDVDSSCNLPSDARDAGPRTNPHRPIAGG
jgi:hypothetical protein